MQIELSKPRLLKHVIKYLPYQFEQQCGALKGPGMGVPTSTGQMDQVLLGFMLPHLLSVLQSLMCTAGS